MVKKDFVIDCKDIFDKEGFKTDRLSSHNISIPIIDSTDHFGFACSNCMHQLNITSVKVSELNKTIWFNMRCPSCMLVYVRKIYLERFMRYGFAYDTDSQAVSYFEGLPNELSKLRQER